MDFIGSIIRKINMNFITTANLLVQLIPLLDCVRHPRKPCPGATSAINFPDGGQPYCYMQIESEILQQNLQ